MMKIKRPMTIACYAGEMIIPQGILSQPYYTYLSLLMKQIINVTFFSDDQQSFLLFKCLIDKLQLIQQPFLCICFKNLIISLLIICSLHTVRIIQGFQMSFKATIDMFVNFSYIQVRFLNHQGYIRYRIKIYMKSQGECASCHPYNIVKGPIKNQQQQTDKSQQKIQSQIDSDNNYYYSRLISVLYRPQKYQQNQTVFFKAYINTQIMDNIQFYCLIQCLFTQDLNSKLQIVGTFQAQIRKFNDISTFLPVSFDAFEGFMIFSTFHSTILQFKYSENDIETLKPKRNKSNLKDNSIDFFSYVQLVTNRFKRQQLMDFYQYYRDFLQKQHQSIQTKHEDLINKLLSQAKTKQEENLIQKNGISHVKIIRNNQLLKFILGRSVYQHFHEPPPIKVSERQYVVQMILKDFTQMKGHVYKKWMQFARFVIAFSKKIAELYRKQYQSLCKQRFKNNVFSHRIKNHDWRISKYDDSGQLNLQHAFSQKQKGETEHQLWKEHFPIQNIEFFGKSQTNIKMFEEIYCINSKMQQSRKNFKKHVLILVHGFQASRQDFVLLKNCLQVVYGVQVIISTCNEGLTQSSIMVAGKRLALQVKKVLINQIGQYRLSFIGHSLGGLIIRSAIPSLQQYSDKFYLYLTYSTPHLGYLYQSSTLIKAGLWLLNKWHKIEALQQLTMKDSLDLRQTVLYQLSKNGSLKKFNKLCFVCSSQDQYVVYESARVQQNQKLMKETLDQNTKQVIREMVNGIIGDIDASQISRINVVFNIQDKNIDSFLGRTGHIKFLSDTQFIRQFCSCFQKFFL